LPSGHPAGRVRARRQPSLWTTGEIGKVLASNQPDAGSIRINDVVPAKNSVIDPAMGEYPDPVDRRPLGPRPKGSSRLIHGLKDEEFADEPTTRIAGFPPPDGRPQRKSG
jgi:hypothetical protein